VNRSYSDAICIRNRVIIEKLLSLENPIKDVRTVENRVSHFEPEMGNEGFEKEASS